MHLLSSRFLRLSAIVLIPFVFLVLVFLFCGYRLLVAEDPLPGHAEAAIVLQGSIVGEKARLAGAINLLRQGAVDRALLSVPKESYWGQAIPPIARTYIEREYGADLAARVDFCELGGDVDSTRQEMEALESCIENHNWRSIIVVTSNYHTRRAGIIWRKLTQQDAHVRVWIDGVQDPEFQQPWWRHRRSAKTFVTESTKLVWTLLGG